MKSLVVLILLSTLIVFPVFAQEKSKDDNKLFATIYKFKDKSKFQFFSIKELRVAKNISKPLPIKKDEKKAVVAQKKAFNLLVSLLLERGVIEYYQKDNTLTFTDIKSRINSLKKLLRL